MKELKGMGLNSLCAIGRIHFYGNSSRKIAKGTGHYMGAGISTELQRFEIALRSIREEQEEEEPNEFYDELYNRIKLAIFEGYDASEAVMIAEESILTELNGKIDPYISAVGAKLSGILSGLYRILSKEAKKTAAAPHPVILICEDISVSELRDADCNMILGIWICAPSHHSELAFYAHSLGVPLIISEDRDIFSACEGETAVIDSENGILILSPDEEAIEHYGSAICDVALKKEKNKGEKRLICFSRGISELEKHMHSMPKALLIEIDEEEASRELWVYFSSVIRDLGCADLRIILPEISEKNGKWEKVVSAAIRASEWGRIMLLVPFAADISAIRALKYRFFTALEEESENISLGAVIDCGASAFMIEEIAAEADLLAVDSDALFESLFYKNGKKAERRPDAETGRHVFLNTAKNMIAMAKGKGAKICFFGMLSSQNDMSSSLLSLGADEIALSAPYIL